MDVGDIIENVSLELMEYLLARFECEWVDIGKVKIIKEK